MEKADQISFTNIHEVLRYISENWDKYQHLMTYYQINQRNLDPTLRSCYKQTKNNIITLAGFKLNEKRGYTGPLIPPNNAGYRFGYN